MITKTLNSWRRVSALRFIVAVSQTHINSRFPVTEKKVIKLIQKVDELVFKF